MRMKGGFHGLRGKQFSIIFIAFVCTTIILWACEKTPFIPVRFPRSSQYLQLSPEVLDGPSPVGNISSNSDVYVNKSGPSPHPATSSFEMIKNTSESMVTSCIIEESQCNDSKGKAKDKPIPGEENNLKQSDQATANASSSSSWGRESGNPMIPAEQEDQPNDSKEKAKDKRITGEEKNSKLPEQVTEIANSISSRGEETMAPADQACNYAKGKWVIDNQRPLYSGSRCKQWLSPMWACRLTQRTDFSYEKLRWQPKYCKMEKFEGSKFLRRMKDKTLAFVGDSLGRQQFQSLMCMVTGGIERPDVLDVGREYGLVKARGAVRPDGWAYRFPETNTTIVYYWSASLCNIEALDAANPATDYAMHLDRPPAFLSRYIHRFNVLVLNTGHHWNRGKLTQNRWVMHVGGIRNTNRKIAEIGRAKNLTVYSIVRWVDSQLPKYPGLKAFFRSLSPRHFFHGDWNTGGTCDNTTPSEGKEVLQDESSDSVAAGAVKGTRVRLLDITAPSELRDEGHISRYSIKATPGVQDCLHWCLPGVPDMWNEMLFAQI
ncbi:Trichome birefringence-like, N-terminal domain [Dillenia turbinata]|uniref:Trichome birefringence-like, N-terminal domain n=1 Tax=Dillenia turbinata TaxID=194707 RepID=A0AAN8VW19_9MAGN